MTHYDCLFISTSPGMMMEAHYHKHIHKNDTIAIFDKASHIGGAWYTTTLFGMDHIEMGPHFFQTEPAINNIKSLYDLSATPTLKPRWILNYSNRSYRLNDWCAKFIIIINGLIKSCSSSISTWERERGHGIRTQLTALYNLFFHYKNATYYLKNGCQQFITSIHTACQNADITIQNTAIETLDFSHDDGLLHVIDTQGNQYTASQLYISDRARFKSYIDKNGHEHPLETLKKTRKQIHLLIETNEKIDFFLYRFVSRPYFAVTNLTHINNGKCPENQYLISATFSNFDPHSKSSYKKPQDVLKSLINFNILPRSSVLIDQHYSEYDDSRLSVHDYRIVIGQSKGLVKMVGDVDLAIWLRQINAKWHSC